MHTRLGGRYELIREIGAGGMGRVFQAMDTSSGRTVAVKVLTASGSDDLAMLLRFQQEGAVLSTLRHPNIVEVYGALLDAEEQMSCIIMEFLEGQSLNQLLRSNRLSLARVKGLALQTVSALAYAHRRGIVHRDVKPDNIMVVGDDRVKVTDFGIARVLHPGVSLNTKTGTTMGTPLYMAPEQIEGQKVDGRADIYSFGAVMYEMIVGRPPFDGDDPITVAFKHVHKDPLPLRTLSPDVPRAWEDLVLRMLAKNPDDRFQSADSLENAIGALPDRSSATETVHPTPENATRPAPSISVRAAPTPAETMLHPGPPTPVSPGAPVTSPPIRRRWITAGAILALAAIAVVAVAMVVRSHGSTTAAHTTSAIATVPSRTIAPSGAAAFRDPESVAVDSHGDAYVADSGNNRILVLSANGSVIRSVGLGQLNGPTGVALDQSGNVYVADSRNSRVVQFSASGTLLHTWGTLGTAPGQFRGLHSVALDSKGNVYVADFGNNRIQKLSPSGQVSQVLGEASGGHAVGQFDQPVDVAVDARDNVYVADFGANRIQVFSPDGSPRRQIAVGGASSTDFARPHGVAVDTAGHIYVAEYAARTVDVFTPTGSRVARLRAPGSGFNHPVDVTLDSSGRLYVADGPANRIFTFVRSK